MYLFVNCETFDFMKFGARLNKEGTMHTRETNENILTKISGMQSTKIKRVKPEEM